MSFTNLDATPGYGHLILIGRETSAVDRSRAVEAEMTAAYVVLVNPPTEFCANTSNEK